MNACNGTSDSQVGDGEHRHRATRQDDELPTENPRPDTAWFTDIMIEGVRALHGNPMDIERVRNVIDSLWNDSIANELADYGKILAKSPDFDPDWQSNRNIGEAVELVAAWCRLRVLMEVTRELDETILLYGHLDKQREMSGWAEDLSPWKPVIKDDKLYGRGGAEKGYAAHASMGEHGLRS